MGIYQSKNKRFVARAHIVTQDLLNQENGGVRDDNITYFETGDPEFIDRSILEVNFRWDELDGATGYQIQIKFFVYF